jgi:tRNA threonylcarbamoyladenosine biosynthesis protein TsaB
MRVLALDTTTRDGSAALLVDDRVIDERRGDPTRTHAERLPGELMALVNDHAVRFADIDLFAVASGPGSFTGLRIGIATIQGLAFVHARRVVAVPALDALAQTAARDAAADTIVGAWIDAHRRDVFAALYRVTDAPPFERERLLPLEAATVGSPADTIRRWAIELHAVPDIVTGDGAVMYGDSARAVATHVRVAAPPPLAGAIGRIAIARARRGEAIDPAAIQPVYVRRPDAELDREKRAQGSVAS